MRKFIASPFSTLSLAGLLTVLVWSPASLPSKAEDTPAVASLTPAGLSLVSTNNRYLLDVLERSRSPLEMGPHDTNIVKLTSRILTHNHYLQQLLDDTVSMRFLDRYLQSLDNLHMHFLQSDLQEFEKYRTTLDDLTYKDGALEPAFEIYTRFMDRLEQRVNYVNELLANETFTFDGDDRYSLDRRKAPWPETLDDAKALWRQHLRYEILQEKLNNEKPDEIAKKIYRRYARLLRTFQDFDKGNVAEFYLSALTHVYDPHSDYMGKSTFDSFAIRMSLSLSGIGAVLQAEDGYCKIRSLLPGPAKRSGKIKEDDRIVAVAQGDGEAVDVVDMPLSKVVDLIRGPKGSEVRLTIIPADAADPSVRKVVTLVRDDIKMEDQEAKANLIEIPREEEEGVWRLGVIDLPTFYADFDLTGQHLSPEARKSTTVDVAKLVRKLKQEKIDGLILDLRKNGGGSLEEAINLTGLFIKEGPVVQAKDYNGRVTVEEDTDPTVLYDGPLVVLTSRFSASASEILAGALQDYGRALIVGDASTHGKGTVQSLIRLDRYIRSSAENPGAVKITIRQFYRPSGASTQQKGIVPDIILPSVNNHAEVGEESLENALAWDQIAPAKFVKVDRVSALIPELRKRSEERRAKNPDFAFIQEDIELFKEALAEKSVSLNESQRLKEKEEAEARKKEREARMKQRPPSDEVVYTITVKLAGEPGLPEPDDPLKKEPESESIESIESEDEEGEDESIPAVDVILNEAKRILIDLIAASKDRGTTVVEAGKSATRQTGL